MNGSVIDVHEIETLYARFWCKISHQLKMKILQALIFILQMPITISDYNHITAESDRL